MAIQTPVVIPPAALPLPDVTDKLTFLARMREMLRWLLQDLMPGVNAAGDAAYANADAAASSAAAAVSAANFKGSWPSLVGTLPKPASAAHSGTVWVLLNDLANVALSEPGVSADWVDIGGIKPAGGIMVGYLSGPANAAGTQYPQAQEVALLATTQLGFRNKVINGNFLVNQDAVSGTVSLTSGQYGHDQWKAGASGCTYTFAASGGITTLTITAGSLIQPLEGATLQTGTHVLSWAGTAQGKIGAGAYGASGQTAAVTGGADLNIEFNIGTLALAQLELGTRKTLFEHRDISAEFLQCQRFYEKISTNTSLFTLSIGLGSYTATWPFRVPKRVTPTVIGLNGGWTTESVNTLAVRVNSGGSAGQLAANFRVSSRL